MQPKPVSKKGISELPFSTSSLYCQQPESLSPRSRQTKGPESEVISQLTPLKNKDVIIYSQTQQEDVWIFDSVYFPIEIWDMILNNCGIQTLKACELVSKSMLKAIDKKISFTKAKDYAKLIAKNSTTAFSDTLVCTTFGLFNSKELQRATEVIKLDYDLIPEEFLGSQEAILDAAISLKSKGDLLKSGLKTFCCVLIILGLIIFIVFGLFFNWDSTHLKVGAAIIFPTCAALGLFCGFLPPYVKSCDEPSLVEHD